MRAAVNAFGRFACYLAAVVEDIRGGIVSGLDRLWCG